MGPFWQLLLEKRIGHGGHPKCTLRVMQCPLCWTIFVSCVVFKLLPFLIRRCSL